jgi:SpoVK/Ycf46/Vps4 family AAA+-type ATPase
MRALREDMEIEKVSSKHFDDAMKDVHASTTKEMLERFRKLDQILRRVSEADPATASMYG